MLMLSHGNTGTPLALHDLATSLARKGFVVVAVMHPGDNSKDHSRLGTLSNLYGRPIQISEAITATLGDPMLSPFVNADQVGVIGYSAGGETALILSGAQAGSGSPAPLLPGTPGRPRRLQHQRRADRRP